MSFVMDPAASPCNEVDLNITGGTVPYTVSLLSG